MKENSRTNIRKKNLVRKSEKEYLKENPSKKIPEKKIRKRKFERKSAKEYSKENSRRISSENPRKLPGGNRCETILQENPRRNIRKKIH